MNIRSLFREIVCAIVLLVSTAPLFAQGQWIQTSLTVVSVHAFAVSGSYLFAGTDGGVYLSIDNGISWTQQNNGLTSANINAFTFSGGNLFAGTTDGGVFLSTDLGNSWSPANNGLTIAVQCLAAKGTYVFAGTLGLGVFLTMNNGANWTPVNNGLPGSSVTALAVDGSSVFAGTDGDGIFISNDNGASWTPVNNGLTGQGIEVRALAVSGTNLFAGTAGGVFLSEDLGNNWVESDNGLLGPTDVITFAVKPGYVYAGTSDDGVSVTSDNGTSWTPMNNGLTDWNVQSLAICNENLFAGILSDGVWQWTINYSPVNPPLVSYITPDIGTPDFNTYIEIIGPYDKDGNFGSDGIYLNNPGYEDEQNNFVEVVCMNRSDSDKIVFGPIIVSQHGKMISTQVFVLPGVQPNSAYWDSLQPTFRIPVQVITNGEGISNADTFYIVKPQPAIIATTPGAIGSGGVFGVRSRRGTMIVDSMNLSGGIFSIDTSDCDPYTPGNQGYLPAVIMSKGSITIAPGATLQTGGNNESAGPGGGGGGGVYDDAEFHVESTGGNGFTGGEGGSLQGGEGTGGYGSVDSNWGGYSLNGMPGSIEKSGALNYYKQIGNATNPSYGGEQGTGGGTGFPFGESGQGGYTLRSTSSDTSNTVGGYGGGSGAAEYNTIGGGIAFGGGGGGNAAAGATTTSGNGFTCGNFELVPLCGGSGGAGGNPWQGIAGYGGGGGGALCLYSQNVFSASNITANGSDGGNTGLQASGSYSGAGGGGAGGGIIISSKGQISINTISANGGKGGAGLLTACNGGDGGKGRVRMDGPILTSPNLFPSGPSTDTSRYVSGTFTLTGTGIGNPLKIYIRPVAPTYTNEWILLDTVSQYTVKWTKQLTIPIYQGVLDSLYFLVVAQQVLNPDTSQYTMEPQWVFSQAAANILHVSNAPLPPRITSAKNLNFDTLLCTTAKLDTVEIYNTGDDTLIISNATIKGQAANAFTIESPSNLPYLIPAGDSMPIVLQFETYNETVLGDDTLLLTNNGNILSDNPWKIAIQGMKLILNYSTNVAYPDTIALGNLPCDVAKDSTVTLTNSSEFPATFLLRSTNFAFSFEDSIYLAAGAEDSIPVHFSTGNPAGEYIDSLVITDTCGGTKTVLFSATVLGPTFFISSIPAIPLCMNENSVQYDTIRNLSIDTESLALANSNNPLFSISPDSMTLAPGDTQILALTFDGAAAPGAYTANYSYLDICDAPHDITMTANVEQIPPLQLSLQPDSRSLITGDVLKVYVVATPLSSVSGVSFTVANELTALHLDSVATFCSATILRDNDSVAFDISLCSQSSSDTIAVLYYHTFIGYTVSPYVRLQNISTTNICETVQNAGGITVTLTLPGCDLGQAVLTPYASGINSIYPNPANRTATVQYSTVENASVQLNLCDVLGRTVENLAKNSQLPGVYTVQFSIDNLANGIYFLTMQEGTVYTSREIWVLK